MAFAALTFFRAKEALFSRQPGCRELRSERLVGRCHCCSASPFPPVSPRVERENVGEASGTRVPALPPLRLAANAAGVRPAARRGFSLKGPQQTRHRVGSGAGCPCGRTHVAPRRAKDIRVGALTVRFITRRFIGDYDPTLEMIYRHMAVIDGEMVHFEILDTAGQEEDSLQIEEKIKWGDGFAVVYSVTDRCSFDEVMRLCFLINHIHSSPKRSSGSEQPPVVIVGNKKDLQFDRMVSTEDGENLSKALKLPFYEISTRDSYEETVAVFNTLYQELMRQGHFSPGSFKRRTVSKLMEKIPKMQASSTLNSAGRSLSFNSFRDYIPE
ncbi:PREDICTED: ras-related and estrogen-regulated growth inhibitor-like [Charadrius vociferus]|uniref:ras-related and estrogen-regulated growth inhibitor-like n=1 Tax=Charadrius vociferus TaxID=50402 RepID=UPI0005218527|nr:PREDICTED: ras-related and estrogen-regulated growth inhibitor-like [Charadrius vociferus]